MSTKRPTRRDVTAAETRRDILLAARRLFAVHGYPATSVQQIAEEAGVALQTIYSSVGSKAALVRALNDLIDEEAGVAELAVGLFEETDPRRLIARVAHLTRQLNERCGDLIHMLESAGSAEPAVAAVNAEGQRRHEQAASRVARRLAVLGALRADTTPERAAAVYALMLSPASWRQLTHTAGWTFDEAETWLAAALTQLLLV